MLSISLENEEEYYNVSEKTIFSLLELLYSEKNNDLLNSNKHRLAFNYFIQLPLGNYKYIFLF